jgi:hypothetical protein
MVWSFDLGTCNCAHIYVHVAALCHAVSDYVYALSPHMGPPARQSATERSRHMSLPARQRAAERSPHMSPPARQRAAERSPHMSPPARQRAAERSPHMSPPARQRAAKRSPHMGPAARQRATGRSPPMGSTELWRHAADGLQWAQRGSLLILPINSNKPLAMIPTTAAH